MHRLYCQAGKHLHSSYMHKWRWTQSSTIYYGLCSPRKNISRVPLTKYLKTFVYFIFISVFISHSVCLYLSVCRRACASACVYFVRAACWDGELNSKCIWSAKHSRAKHTQNKTHIHAQRLAYSIKIISVTESILRSSNKPFFLWYKSLLFIPTVTHTQTDTCTLCSELHSLVVILHSHNALCSLFSGTGFVPGKSQREDLSGFI